MNKFKSYYQNDTLNRYINKHLFPIPIHVKIMLICFDLTRGASKEE